MEHTDSLNEKTSLRRKIGVYVESKFVRGFIVAIILINSITLGMNTSPYFSSQYGNILNVVDMFILYIFVTEISLKLVAFGFRFFRDGWNVFDFIIVGIALFPDSGIFSVLRILRIFRLLRAISLIPSFRLVIESLLHSIPGIASIVGLMVVLYYIFAVIATTLFGHAFPDWFGTLGKSMYSLFQIMTLESWSMGISRPVMEVFPYAWLFFITFILVATFAMMNLFIAIIVDTMQTIHKKEDRKTESPESKQLSVLQEEISSLRSEISELKTLIHNNHS